MFERARKWIRGVPPDITRSDVDASPRYVSEMQISDAEIEAGMKDGELALWRVDAVGTQWFKRQPIIRAVPPSRDE